jgi:uncharacterized protein (TIGR02145 family)
MPTWDEMKDLGTYNTVSSTSSWSSSSNTNYGNATHFGPNASTKTLTLPAAGYHSFLDGSLIERGTYGMYWTSTESTSNPNAAYPLIVSNVTIFGQGNQIRTQGYSIRCIAQ